MLLLLIAAEVIEYVFCAKHCSKLFAMFWLISLPQQLSEVDTILFN